jgi:hypothetical protein
MHARDADPKRHGVVCARATYILLAFAVGPLACCSSHEEAAAPAATTSFALLPGEDMLSAQLRIVDGCMEETNEPYHDVTAVENSVERPNVRAYDTANPGTEERYEECLARWDELAQVPEPTDEDFRAGYAGTVAFVACLADRGYDLGTVVSEEEYVASRGQAGPSSQWSDVANDGTPAFSDDFMECAAEQRPVQAG